MAKKGVLFGGNHIEYDIDRKKTDTGRKQEKD